MDIAFIVGSARSGTSILGELVSSHPRIAYIYEEPVWKKMEVELDSHVLNINKIPAPKRKKLRAWLKSYIKSPKTYIVEKNPRHIVRVPFIKALFPEAKIIHIVRDGRDTACSLKTGLCGKTWAHVKPTNWRQIEKDYTGVVRCAHAWKATLEIAVNDLKKVNHLQVRYEDLIEDPIREAKRIFDYLGLPLDPKVREFCEKIQNEMQNSYVAKNQVRWYKEDHTVRMGRWKENMTPEEQVEVEKILRPLLDVFGYK